MMISVLRRAAKNKNKKGVSEPKIGNKRTRTTQVGESGQVKM